MAKPQTAHEITIHGKTGIEILERRVVGEGALILHIVSSHDLEQEMGPLPTDDPEAMQRIRAEYLRRYKDGLTCKHF